MDILIRYGFTIEEIKNMMDSNQEIDEVSDEDIDKLIDLLGHVGCLSNHIKNIFITNPFYLNRKVKDIEQLINKLKTIGLKNLNILFDSNPYILNLNSTDIDEIYQEKINQGLTKEEIINYFYYDLDRFI